MVKVRTVGEARRLLSVKLDEYAMRERGVPYGHRSLHHRTRAKFYAAVLGDLKAFGELPLDCDPEKHHWPGLLRYLPDGEDFTDMEVKPMPDPAHGLVGYDVLCPVCKGHGGWNLDLNAYGPGKHFRASCSQCNGYGWVHPANAVCIHQWREVGYPECKERGLTHYGHCWHVYECTKCGVHTAADSSD